MGWIYYNFEIKKPMANLMIESRSIQSQRFHLLAPLTNKPQQHMCIHDENQLLKSRIKIYQKFLVRLPQTTLRRASKNARAQHRLIWEVSGGW